MEPHLEAESNEERPLHMAPLLPMKVDPKFLHWCGIAAVASILSFVVYVVCQLLLGSATVLPPINVTWTDHSDPIFIQERNHILMEISMLLDKAEGTMTRTETSSPSTLPVSAITLSGVNSSGVFLYTYFFEVAAKKLLNFDNNNHSDTTAPPAHESTLALSVLPPDQSTTTSLILTEESPNAQFADIATPEGLSSTLTEAKVQTTTSIRPESIPPSEPACTTAPLLPVTPSAESNTPTPSSTFSTLEPIKTTESSLIYDGISTEKAPLPTKTVLTPGNSLVNTNAAHTTADQVPVKGLLQEERKISYGSYDNYWRKPVSLKIEGSASPFIPEKRVPERPIFIWKNGKIFEVEVLPPLDNGPSPSPSVPLFPTDDHVWRREWPRLYPEQVLYKPWRREWPAGLPRYLAKTLLTTKYGYYHG